jgi:hypothetical protein
MQTSMFLGNPPIVQTEMRKTIFSDVLVWGLERRAKIISDFVMERRR